jgi:hypothetical protein
MGHAFKKGVIFGGLLAAGAFYAASTKSGKKLVEDVQKDVKALGKELQVKLENSEESYSVAADMAMPPMMPLPSVNGSRNAELYQRAGYSASYETRKFKETCTAIEDLKPLSYVLFDSANNGERYCSYSFRVEKEKTDEIVTKLKALKPTRNKILRRWRRVSRLFVLSIRSSSMRFCSRPAISISNPKKKKCMFAIV